MSKETTADQTAIVIPDVPPPDAAMHDKKDDGDKKRKPGRPKGSTKSQPKVDPPPPKAPGRISQRETLRQGIKGLYETVGMGLGIAPGLMPVGMQCVTQAEEIADAWMEACDQSPQIKRFWEQMLTTSVYSKLIMAHAPIAIAAVGPRIGGLFGGGGSGNEAPDTGVRTAAAQASPPPPNAAPAADTGAQNPGSMPFNPAFAESPNGNR